MSLLDLFETQEILRRRVVVTVILLIIALSVVEIWVVNRLSTYGEQTSKLEETKLQIILENQILENEISKHESFLEIQKKASDLGFEKMKNTEYIH